MTKNEKKRKGQLLIDILGIKRLNKQSGKENQFYQTVWGSKTPLGIYETVLRIIKEG